MFSLAHARVVRALTLATVLTTTVAGTALAGTPTHGQVTRQLSSTLTIDNLQTNLDIRVTFEGTPPPPGSREEAGLLFSIKSLAAEFDIRVIDGLWGGNDEASFPSDCHTETFVDIAGNIQVFHVNCRPM